MGCGPGFILAPEQDWMKGIKRVHDSVRNLTRKFKSLQMPRNAFCNVPAGGDLTTRETRERERKNIARLIVIRIAVTAFDGKKERRE